MKNGRSSNIWAPFAIDAKVGEKNGEKIGEKNGEKISQCIIVVINDKR